MRQAALLGTRRSKGRESPMRGRDKRGAAVQRGAPAAAAVRDGSGGCEHAIDRKPCSGTARDAANVVAALPRAGGAAGARARARQRQHRLRRHDAGRPGRDNNKDGETFAIGRGAGNYAWSTCAHSPCGGNTNSVNALSTLAMDGQTHWVVLKFVFASASSALGASGGTQITFWLDPMPGTTDPDPSSALTLTGNSQTNQKTVAMPALHFVWIEFGGQQATFALDEMRLADSLRI